jgi:hypothetical protein
MLLGHSVQSLRSKPEQWAQLRWLENPSAELWVIRPIALRFAGYPATAFSESSSTAAVPHGTAQ